MIESGMRKESDKPQPPTYFNRKVGDKFIYRGETHRVVAIHSRPKRETRPKGLQCYDCRDFQPALPAPHDSATGMGGG